MPRARARARNVSTHWAKDERWPWESAGGDRAASVAAVAPPNARISMRRDTQLREWDWGGLVGRGSLDLHGWVIVHRVEIDSVARFGVYIHFVQICGSVHGCFGFASSAGRLNRKSDNGLRCSKHDILSNFGAASPDQPFVGGDERHVRVDENPAVFCRHLKIEMQMVGGGALAPLVVADLADDLALMHHTPADYAVLVELPRQHVKVAEPHP